ncbi:hypothetical protein D081_2142 [Anaerovibrio sp. JC8]|uniref:M15 family metallopeptidase n=1 Tax=Anaerovibrio sp. JC8 TaxID=1240085 RepID=UPI000A0DA8D3|nr:M15 family metallopeptidase [Anaerovibrio sp. JC8]ORT99172.1 hypothetical protein D081_2142 [Anaerovibrio sp. JC8]
MDKNFYISDISPELFAKMEGKSFSKGCPLPVTELKYLHFLHKNLAGETLEGEMVCNFHIAERLMDIFKKLYEAGYPMEKFRLIDEYNGDDDLSMADNNGSSFNFRVIAHTNRISKHGLGLAVDVNPLYNPYMKPLNGGMYIVPENGRQYCDREKDFPYKIVKDDLCCRLFEDNGFEWGGDWEEQKDYQHFEIPASQIIKWYPDFEANI